MALGRRIVKVMRLSTVILPIHQWGEGQKISQQAEDLGFHAAYTYDHLSWRSFWDEPWFGAVPTLTAAATATQSMRLRTLVTSVKPRSYIRR
jgi:alkanesulfonate monooxygenase SsuD/methylene tetrahydromethanopterin reductase-like flavin-dependent oxidoreductase (luciferase family)